MYPRNIDFRSYNTAIRICQAHPTMMCFPSVCNLILKEARFSFIFCIRRVKNNRFRAYTTAINVLARHDSPCICRWAVY